MIADPFTEMRVTEQDEVSEAVKLLPVELGKKLQTRARKSTSLKLDNYIDLRDFISENEEKILAVGWMGFYEEAGDWMDYSGETIRKNLTIIRSYPDDKLREWVKNGLSFDHIERANDLQNVKECQYDAAHILDAAFQLGNKNGTRMTVTEMETFALGEKDRTGGAGRMFRSILQQLGDFPNKFKWDGEKTSRFRLWIEAGKEFLA
jgi:hypothetical protein